MEAPENGENVDDSGEYISGLDSLNEDQENHAYIDIALEASTNGWDRATEAKVRQLADQLRRMPTADEINAALNE